MTLSKFYELRDSGQIQTKIIFVKDEIAEEICDEYIVVESFVWDGWYYIVDSDVNVRRETASSEILWFKTANEANEFFKKYIKDTSARMIRKQNNAFADYVASWGPLD